MLRIGFGKKFTSVHFENIIAAHWSKSFAEKYVVFNLKELEWVAIEQLSFFISWVNSLAVNRVKVTIELPDAQDVMSKTPVYEKRKRCLNQLLIDWQLQKVLDKKVELIYGQLPLEKAINREAPYYELSTIKYNAQEFDSDFNEIYTSRLNGFLKYVAREISANTSLEFFDNHFLHYSVVKEFFSNCCQHAFSDLHNTRCYLALHFNSKIVNYKSATLDNILRDRYAERPEEEQHFFKGADGAFINNSFVEFTFMDFGAGVSRTLKDRYRNEAPEKIKDKLSNQHFNQEEDTRVLEYAFLPFTSKYELKEELEMHDYIPRGLYIIKDIVKRYGGMVIARSNRGKVVFDYSKENTSTSEEVIYRKEKPDAAWEQGFPGTCITIVLPAKRKMAKKEAAPKVAVTSSAQLPVPCFINLLDVLKRSLSREEVENQGTEIEKRLKFYELFFHSICQEILASENKGNCVVLIDFAGVERSKYDIYSKFLYFLAYCPLTHQSLGIILFNVLEKQINDAVISQPGYELRSKGFFAKPIPCIYPDHSVSWLGIPSAALQDIITAVWKQDHRHNNIKSDVQHFSGNILQVNPVDDHTAAFEIKIQSFYEIKELIYKYHQHFIGQEVANQGIRFRELMNEEYDYNVVLVNKYNEDRTRQRAFLTANGKYQEDFLTFVEKLYIREYRRLIATYFLFNFYYSSDEADLSQLTKVLTVTLSSQLLGKEFTDIVNELELSDHKVELIPLSNYYDFFTEEPFGEISGADSVIVVNDVISTGNLSKKVTKSLQQKKSRLLSFITIVDSRTDEEKETIIDANIISLFSRPTVKFETNPFPDTNPVWINPILNAPTSMSRSRSNRESILTHPQVFMEYFKDPSLFKVGFFKRNSVYHTYYLQTDRFFKSEVEGGFPIIMAIMEAFTQRLTDEKNSSLGKDLEDIKRIKQNILKQALTNESEDYLNHQHSLRKFFSMIEKKINSELTRNKQYSIFDYKHEQVVDFIFYPFLSPVAEIEKNPEPVTFRLRGQRPVEIYTIPRIMTPKGWRFSFPPKFLNFHTRNKKALILDDGSCTGETLIQMIDTLSYLELSELNVLSIFARLEDFQREFLTRIKEVKVTNTVNKNMDYKFIPLNVFFGTHFHIPVYTKANHPYAIEKKELETVKAHYSGNSKILPEYLRIYMEQRLALIGNPDTMKDSRSEFPEIINTRQMFVIRDMLGNYDSYRLFKEDEQEYAEVGEEGAIKSLKILLEKEEGQLAFAAVLNLEPHLIDTVKRIYPALVTDLENFLVEGLTASSPYAQDIDHYYFLLRSLARISIHTFFNEKFLFMVLNTLDDLLAQTGEHIALNFLGYFYTSIILHVNPRSNSQLRSRISLFLQNIWLQIDKEKTFEKRYASLFRALYYESLLEMENVEEGEKVDALTKVKRYYAEQSANHTGKKEASHPNDYVTLSGFVTTLQGNFRGDPSEANKQEFVKNLRDLYNKLDQVLLSDLNKVVGFLSEFYTRHDLNHLEINKYQSLLSAITKLNEASYEAEFTRKTLATDNLPRVANWIKVFQQHILLLEGALPQFIMHDKVNVHAVIGNTMAEFEHAKQYKPGIQLEVDESLDLRIHPYFFRIMIYEFIENRRKYADGSTATFIVKEENKNVVFKYVQEASFKKNSGETGLITIRNIAAKYSGESEIRITSDKYEFHIFFHSNIKLN